jgi:transcriptional regulator
LGGQLGRALALNFRGTIAMYMPQHFAETDVPTLHGLIHAQPLGAWVLHDGTQLLANHVPFALHADEGVLRCHVARANPAWKACAGNAASCVVMFQGPQHYISPSWYPSKKEHGKAVPTWNYAVVHVHGRARAIDDAQWLHANVSWLTTQHEAGRDQPWQVSDAPTDYIDKMIAAIVGIEITIERIEGKWKTSQNQPEANRGGVVHGLQQDGDAAAVAMAGLVSTRSP